MEQKIRKIIHIDMDAFFASVEQVKNPQYKGKPLIVGGRSSHGIVTTASYEARAYGVHSAMPVSEAKRLCPQAIVVTPNKGIYSEYSKIIKKVFLKYTDLVEQASIDEAYLDVTENKLNIDSATELAKIIQKDVFETTSMTCSCGVSYNKFLAKTASDINKPNGIYVITPKRGQEFVSKISIHKFHGIGRKTAKKLIALGIYNGEDLYNTPLDALNDILLSRGEYYYYIARGIDNTPINPKRQIHSISRERTFNNYIATNSLLKDTLIDIFEETFNILNNKDFIFPKTVTIKIKDENFTVKTRSKSLKFYTKDRKLLLNTMLEILDDIEVESKIRLAGVGFSNFSEVDETNLINKNTQLKLF